MKVNNKINDLRPVIAGLNSFGLNSEIIDFLHCMNIVSMTENNEIVFNIRDRDYNLVGYEYLEHSKTDGNSMDNGVYITNTATR